MRRLENEIYNPPKGSTGFSWFFEQCLYHPGGVARAVKAEQGSGNIPKVIICTK